MNRVGIKQATHFKTVAEWNIAFRRGENFPHPNPRVQCGKVPLPRLFEKFPEAKDSIVEFAVKNLTTLTLESLHEFTITKLMPALFEIWKEEESELAKWKDDSEFLTMEQFLETHGLSTVGLTTVWRWMHDLGFSYDMRKKSFYVDGHERSDVVAYRHSFCTDYLTVYEPRCLRWVQLPKDKAMKMEGVDVEFGYEFDDSETNIKMVEFHVDYCQGITGLKDEAPRMSVRAPPESKPLMILGQDECVFTQFLLGQRTWVGPKGERPLLPKTEGEGYMLSAFVSRDLGFGRPLSKAELETINVARQPRLQGGGNRT
jgi:hypothetical protein